MGCPVDEGHVAAENAADCAKCEVTQVRGGRRKEEEGGVSGTRELMLRVVAGWAGPHENTRKEEIPVFVDK